MSIVDSQESATKFKPRRKLAFVIFFAKMYILYYNFGMNTQPQFPRNNNEKPFIFNALAHNDEFLRADQDLHAENQTLIRLKAEIYALSGGMDHQQFQDLIEQFVSHYMPQKEGLELEIAKLKKQIELAGSSLSMEDIVKILQEIEDKREEDREQFLQNKKLQENLTKEEKDDLKKKFRYISRLVHPDTTEIKGIDPKYLTLLTELKDAGALGVITQIYENIEVRGQSIEQAFSKYMGENQENKTVSDTKLNIVRVQNEIIKYSKLKELLQQVRGSADRIQSISKQLDDELDMLRDEKDELEKVLEGLKMEDIEQSEDISNSIVTVKNEVNSEQLEQPTGELSLENQIEKDRKDWEKAKRVMEKFLKDILEGTFGKLSNNTVYIDDMYIHVNLNNKKIDFLKTQNRRLDLTLQIGEAFDSVQLRSNYPDNLSNIYNQFYQQMFPDTEWEYYHSDTFEKVWNYCKANIKDLVKIDLDELYGDGSEDANNGDSKISATKTENKLEKRDIWNPRNFEETMVAVKELEVVIKNHPLFEPDSFNQCIISKKQSKYTQNLRFRFSKTDIGMQATVFSTKTDWNLTQAPEYAWIGFHERENTYHAKGFGEIDTNTNVDAQKVDAPKFFQSLKNKLKEFGIDLDAM
jgi:hypothetical protein